MGQISKFVRSQTQGMSCADALYSEAQLLRPVLWTECSATTTPNPGPGLPVQLLLFLPLVAGPAQASPNSATCGH